VWYRAQVKLANGWTKGRAYRTRREMSEASEQLRAQSPTCYIRTRKFYASGRVEDLRFRLPKEMPR
jgi:hypothetical protein